MALEGAGVVGAHGGGVGDGGCALFFDDPFPVAAACVGRGVLASEGIMRDGVRSVCAGFRQGACVSGQDISILAGFDGACGVVLVASHGGGVCGEGAWGWGAEGAVCACLQGAVCANVLGARGEDAGGESVVSESAYFALVGA